MKEKIKSIENKESSHAAKCCSSRECSAKRSGSSSLLLKKYVKNIISPPCPFLVYFCVESAHRLLDAGAATAKFQLKSVQKQSVKLLVFFCSSKVMQCPIYTQQNRPFTILFFLLKKEPHGAVPCCESRREKNGAFKASVCCVPALVAFHPAQIRKSVRVPAE